MMNKNLHDCPSCEQKHAYAPQKEEPRPEPQMTDNEKINLVAARILEQYRPAFEELAK